MVQHCLTNNKVSAASSHFFVFFASFCTGQVSQQQHKGYNCEAAFGHCAYKWFSIALPTTR